MEMNAFSVILGIFMLLMSAVFVLAAKITLKKISDLETAVTSVASINTELENLKKTLGDAQGLWDRMRECEKLVATISAGCQFERDRFKELTDRVNIVSGIVDNIEKNYVNRFDEVKTVMIDSKEEIMKEIGELKLNLAENYVKKSELKEHGKMARRSRK